MSAMRTLTIGAANLASARGFLDALGAFQAELVMAGDGTYQVRIEVDATDHSAVQAPNGTAARAPEPARLEVDGRRYPVGAANEAPAPTTA